MMFFFAQGAEMMTALQTGPHQWLSSHEWWFRKHGSPAIKRFGSSAWKAIQPSNDLRLSSQPQKHGYPAIKQMGFSASNTNMAIQPSNDLAFQPAQATQLTRLYWLWMYFLITRLLGLSRCFFGDMTTQPSLLDAPPFFPSLSVVFFLQDHEASEAQVHAQPVLLHNALYSFVGRLAPHTRSANPHHVAHEAFRSIGPEAARVAIFLQTSLNEQSSDASAPDCTSVALFQLLALPSCHSARGVHGPWRQIFFSNSCGNL